MFTKYKNRFIFLAIFLLFSAVVISTPINLMGNILIANAEDGYEGEEDDALGEFMSIISDGEGNAGASNIEIRGLGDVDEEIGDIRKSEYKNATSTATSTEKITRLPRPERPAKEFKNLGEIISLLNQRDLASTTGEVKKTILEQKRGLAVSEMRIQKIQKGSNFGKFFFGVDRDSLDGLKKDSLEIQVRTEKLLEITSSSLASSTEEISDEELDRLQDEINAIKASRQEISKFVDENKDRRGVLGWFVDLFR
jgi:hypothetical protein